MNDDTGAHSAGLASARWRNRLLLTVLCVPMFLVLLDVLAMNTAMATIGRAFHLPVARWPEAVDAYTVPLALAVLPGGWLVDLWGPRRALLAGNSLFTCASAVGALAGVWPIILGARVGQGLAAALMLPAGLAALSLAWPDPAPRARALGMWSSVSALATALGPAVGGLLVGTLSWRAIFWINLPLTLFAVVGTWILVEPGTLRSPSHTGAQPPARWLAIVGSVVAAAMMTAGANGTLQVVTIYLQSGRQVDATRAGLFLLLATVPFVVLGPWSSKAVQRFSRRTVAAAGFVVGACGLATLGWIPTIIGLVPGLLGIGIGLGLMTSAIVGESIASWPARPGTASGLNNALRQSGTSLGVALAGWAASRGAGEALLRHTGIASAAWWFAAAVVVMVSFAPSVRDDDL